MILHKTKQSDSKYVRINFYIKLKSQDNPQDKGKGKPNNSFT